MRIIYGINPVREALKYPDNIESINVSSARKDAVVDSLVRAAQKSGVIVKRLAADEIARLSGDGKHQGIVAILRSDFRYRDMDELVAIWKSSGQPAFFLVIDGVQDPQNLGSLIRAACSAGVHGVVIPKDRACEVTPTVVKASAGATEHVAIAREVNITKAIEELKRSGVWVAGIEAHCKDSIYKSGIDGDIAIVVGSEGKGIRRLVLESCDMRLCIPTVGGVNSLNAAQAGVVALFEARRQRLCSDSDPHKKQGK